MDRKPRTKSKSPARTKKSSKSKSPVRTKSPGRAKSPGRPKSPSRKKSPARPKSPSRKISPVRKTSPQRKQSSTKNAVDSISTKTIELSEKVFRNSPVVRLTRDSSSRDSTSAEVMERSISQLTSTSALIGQNYSSETLIRRSTRIRQNEDNIRSFEDKILKANNTPLPPQFERKFGEKSVREFGSWPGALVSMLALPAVALALQMSCTKNKCAGLVQPPVNWKVYLDLPTAGIYVGFVLLQAVLSALPLGRKASYGYVQARLSGFYIALLTLAGLAAIYYYTGFNVTSVLNRSLSLLTTAILFALLLSIALFVKAGRGAVRRNINADGNKVYDLFIGRELQPNLGPLNFKAWIVRTELITILLLDALYLLKWVETHAAGVYSPTLLFVVAAHTIYVLDALWFEEKFMTSFEAQYEGLGYMSVMAAAVWPFLITLITRFVHYSGYEAQTYRLALCGILFAIGYFVYRASNSQKAEFRKNPQHPVFAKLDIISTFHGKRLLAGGWWGWLRHPNYLGDAIMAWALASVCGLAHWLPYVFPALLTMVLIHRTTRVGSRCRTLYGAAWDRYAQVVKYRLIPRVY